MIILKSGDQKSILVPIKYKSAFSIPLLDKDFDILLNDEEEGDSDLQDGEKQIENMKDVVVEVNFAKQEELMLVTTTVENPGLTEDICHKILDKGNALFVKILKICQYLGCEHLEKHLKKEFIRRVNKLASSGSKLADFKTQTDKAKELSIFLKNDENSIEISEIEQKEKVMKNRHINGLRYPQVLKYEEFYCKENIDVTHVYTNDKIKELEL